MRRPASGALSRHIPVRAFSMTTGEHLDLESGLEHDLVRMVDRDPAVTWIVSQPCLLEWGRGRAVRRHVADLLTTDSDGEVCLWDAKAPTGASSDAFAEVRAITEAACAEVGWRYVVFTGLPAVHRHNLIWLQGFRVAPPLASRYEADLLEAAATGTTIGDLIRTTDPEEVSVVWHLIWNGKLVIDLAQRLVPTTPVTS
ncbi:MAG: TnsA-like heteromeric transposase endonuclease subunit [Mycobacterium sp.]